MPPMSGAQPVGGRVWITACRLPTGLVGGGERPAVDLVDVIDVGRDLSADQHGCSITRSRSVRTNGFQQATSSTACCSRDLELVRRPPGAPL